MLKIVNISRSTITIQGIVIYPLKSVVVDSATLSEATLNRLDSLERNGLIKIYKEEVTKRVVRTRKTKLENKED